MQILPPRKPSFGAAFFIAEKGFAMPLKKPPSIEADEFKSAKWDEVTRGRDFRESDAPTLEVLMEWYSVVRQCIDDRQYADGQVAYTNDMGDLRQLPQIATMKTASAEIRALNKQLGIADGHEGAKRDAGKPRITVLDRCRRTRQDRRPASAN